MLDYRFKGMGGGIYILINITSVTFCISNDAICLQNLIAIEAGVVALRDSPQSTHVIHHLRGGAVNWDCKILGRLKMKEWAVIQPWFFLSVYFALSGSKWNVPQCVKHGCGTPNLWSLTVTPNKQIIAHEVCGLVRICRSHVTKHTLT